MLMMDSPMDNVLLTGVSKKPPNIPWFEFKPDDTDRILNTLRSQAIPSSMLFEWVVHAGFFYRSLSSGFSKDS